jgi:uncharacterized protein YjdB
LYVAVSAVAGSSVVVTNLTPLSVTVAVATNMLGAQIQQATVTASFLQATNVPVTSAAIDWTSSDTNILTVSSSGLITALSGGNATVSATVGGVTATSASITVALTAPIIPQQPAAEIAVVGESATFTVEALGGDLTYQRHVDFDQPYPRRVRKFQRPGDKCTRKHQQHNGNVDS